MFFVTVGTTMPFDSLVKKIDEMVETGLIDEEVLCQIGNGSYIPRHCDYFRFKPDVDSYIQDASLVVGHGGTGTVLGLLAARKRFVAVVNPMGAHDHQAQFLARLDKSVSILWTRDISELPELVKRAREHEIQALEEIALADDLKEFLEPALHR